MFTAARFIAAPNIKLPKYREPKKYVNKLQHIHPAEHKETALSGLITAHTDTGWTSEGAVSEGKPGTKVCGQRDAIQRRQETSASAGGKPGP